MRTLLTLLALSLALTACGGGGQPKTQPDPSPQPTPVGTPVGSPVTKVIGAAGGSLTSADGKVRVEIPAGALTKDETVTIQEITNQAHGKVGRAFRLTPEGVKFAKPVRITLAYTDADLAGSVPELLKVAYQDGKGLWHAYNATGLDASSKTLTVETDHFSDWSLVSGAQLRPGAATVETGEKLSLEVVVCEFETAADGLLTSLVRHCQPSEVVGRMVGNWSVNGVAGGSGATGTVAPSAGRTATYTAPAQTPAQNPVAVSAEYTPLEGREKVLLVANVQVEGKATGGFRFTQEGSVTIPEPAPATGHKTFTHSQTETTLSSEFIATATGGYLSTETRTDITRTTDSHWYSEVQGTCGGNSPVQRVQSTESWATGEMKGGVSGPMVAELKLNPDGNYQIIYRAHGAKIAGSVTRRTKFDDFCDPSYNYDRSSTDDLDDYVGDQQEFVLEGRLDPARPNHFEGTHTETRVLGGARIPTTVTITWNFDR